MFTAFPKIKNWVIIIFIFFIFLDVLVWREILFNSPDGKPGIYFLDVGQGDSELIELPGNVKFLIDGGPDGKVIGNLEDIFSYFDRRIDLVVMSHAQLDHFGGLLEVLKRYQVGAFVWSGIKNDTASFSELEKVLGENKIPQIVLAEGDRIRYQENNLEIIYPPGDLSAVKNINDAALVLKFSSDNGKALFTADIGDKIEKYLSQKYDLQADILKVAHHGSKYSSMESFLKEIQPKISVIEVGKNSYGHPTSDVLARLSDVGSKIFRTDKNGIIKLILNDGQIDILAQK